MSWTPVQGLRVSYGGVVIIERSSLAAREIETGRLVAGYPVNPPTVIPYVFDNGAALQIQPGPSTTSFAYVLQAQVTDEEGLSVRTWQSVRGDESVRTRTDWGWLSASVLKCAPYTATRTDAEPKTGFLPCGWTVTPWLQEQVHAQLKFTKLTARTRMGAVTLATENEDEAPLILQAIDKDTSASHAGGMAFVLTAGTRELHDGDYGELGIRLTIDPAQGWRAQPAATVEEDAPATTITNVGEVLESTPPSATPTLIPQPQKLRTGSGRCVLPQPLTAYLVSPASPGARRGVLVLQRILRQRWGLGLQVKAVRSLPERGLIIGEPHRSRPLREFCRRAGIMVTPESPGAEGYRLAVRNDTVLIAGSDPAGCFYGCMTLAQLMAVDENGAPTLPRVEVTDWPDFSFRGVHLLADSGALQWQTELIEKVLAPLKFNAIVLECEYGQWESHPEIATSWAMSKEDMRSLRRVAEEHLMQVIPLVQSLGHTSWVFAHGQHLDLAEDPEAAYAICPSSEAARKLLFDVYQEAIDVFRPAYFHIGLDEITNRGRFGVCPRCQGQPPAELFRRHIEALAGFLRRRGIRPMMWGDMLLREGEARFAAHGGGRYDFAAARDFLARDIVIGDWHYNPYRDYASIGLFERQGFPTIGATWHNAKNIHYFATSAMKARAMGMLQTTWTGHNGNDGALAHYPEQYYAFVTAGENFWTAGRPPVESTPYDRGRMLRAALNAGSMRRRSADGFLVDLSPLCNVKVRDSLRSRGWTQHGPQHDFRHLPHGLQRLDGVLFRLTRPDDADGRRAILLRGLFTSEDFPARITVSVDAPAERVEILHACAWPASQSAQVGVYRFRLRNGERYDEPLIYGKNILAWDDSSGNHLASVAWRGQTLAEAPVRVFRMEWKNPHPRSPLTSIDLISAGGEASPVIFAITGVAPAVTEETATPAITAQDPNDKPS